MYANTIPSDRRREWCDAWERSIQKMSVEAAQKKIDEEWFWQYCRGNAEFEKQLDSRPVVVETNGEYGKLVIELRRRDGKS